MEKMKDPKGLRCHHSFCCDCLQSLMANNRGPEIPCPTCRVMTKIPQGGIKAIPVDFKVKMFTEVKYEPQILCSICKNKGDFFCKECKDYMCQSCSESHKKRDIFRSHLVIAMEKENREAEICPSHPGKVLDYSCVDCDLLVCSICVMTSHGQCQVIPAAEYVINCHDAIRSAVDQLEKVHVESNSVEISFARELSHGFNRNVSKIAERIRKRTDTRIKEIQAEGQTLLESLEKERVQVEKVVSNAEKAESTALKVQELKSKCDDFLGTRNVCEIVSHFKALSRDMNQTVSDILDIQADVPSHITTATGFAESSAPDTLGSITTKTVNIVKNVRRKDNKEHK